MAKGSSWGTTQEAYVNSDLAKERLKVAELTGVLHRTCGNLGIEADVERLSEWNAKREAERREVKNDAAI